MVNSNGAHCTCTGTTTVYTRTVDAEAQSEFF